MEKVKVIRVPKELHNELKSYAETQGKKLERTALEAITLGLKQLKNIKPIILTNS